MPQRRWHNRTAQVMWADGYREPDDTTTARQLIEGLADFLADHPAKSKILNELFHIKDLGFDLTEPGMVERAIRLGEIRYFEAVDGKHRRMREHEARMADRTHPPVVYYMRMSDLVKIGTTTQIGERFSVIGPEEVMGVEFGSFELEGQRHAQFAALYSHGEWFRLDAGLCAHIDEVSKGFEVATGVTVGAWLAERLRPRRPRFFSAATPSPSRAGHASSESSPNDPSGSADPPSRSGP